MKQPKPIGWCKKCRHHMKYHEIVNGVLGCRKCNHSGVCYFIDEV